MTAVTRVRGLGYHLRLLLRPVKLLYMSGPRNSSHSNSSATPPKPAISPTTADTTIASATISSTIPWNIHGNTTVTVNQSPLYQQRLCDYGYLVLHEMITRLTNPRHFADRSINITTASLPAGTCLAETYAPLLEEILQQGKVTRYVTSNSRELVEVDVIENTHVDFSFLQAEIEAHIIASGNKDRDLFEKIVLSKFFHHMTELQFSDWTVTLKAIDLSSKFHSDETKHAEFDTDENSYSSKQTFVPYKISSDLVPLYHLEHLFITISGRLLCPYISFEPEEFEMKGSAGNTRIIFPYYFDQENNVVVFEETSHPTAAWLTSDGRLEMCVNTFFAVFSMNVTVLKPGSDMSVVRQVMSAAFSSISVVFLVMISVTYALFRQLRSLPGLNNMALSLSLGTAQLVLVIPWHRTGNSRMCSVLGVATHWAWLMALSWMGVCCQHMVRVFVSKTRHALTESQVKKMFARRLLLTFLLSGSIVAATIVVSLALSGGTRFGYGGTMCFLDMSVHQLLILAFLMPLGLVVTCNIGCFIFTVAAIVRVRRLQARPPSEGRDVLVYAKLVTVTGGAWILGLLAEVADREWMRVMAELCTAGQGLLLFLAFVCNARVWNLYRERFISPMLPQTLSISDAAASVS